MTSKDLISFIITNSVENKKKGTLTFFVVSLVALLFAVITDFSFSSLSLKQWILSGSLWVILYVSIMVYIDDANKQKAAKEQQEKDDAEAKERQDKLEAKAEKKEEYSEKDVREYYRSITQKTEDKYENGNWKAEVIKEDRKYVKVLYNGQQRVARKILK